MHYYTITPLPEGEATTIKAKSLSHAWALAKAIGLIFFTIDYQAQVVERDRYEYVFHGI